MEDDAFYKQKHPTKYNRIVEVTIRKEGCRYGSKIRFTGTHKILYKISYSFHSKIQKKSNIYGELRKDIAGYLKRLCAYKGVEIIEGHMMIDHVHMLVSIPPKYSVSQVMGYLKGKSALMIFENHANLKYKYGNRHFWAEGYYVSTVGLNEATIQKYIAEQEKADMALDKLSVKEYEDPFGEDKVNRKPNEKKKKAVDGQ